MGDVCGEFLAHLFRLDVIGHVHQQHDRPEDAAHFHTGDVRPDVAAVDLQQLAHGAALVKIIVSRRHIVLRLCFGLPQRIQKCLVVGEDEDGFVVPVFLFDAEQCRCGAVRQLDLVRIVQDEDALYHMLLDESDDVPFVVQFLLHPAHLRLELCLGFLVFFVLVLCLLFLVQVQKDKYRQQHRRHRSECPSDPFHD